MLSHEEWQAVSLSFKVASLSTLALLPLAFTLAWLLARKNFPGKSLLNLVIHMPLVVPPVVTGYALLLSFGRLGDLLRRHLFLPLDRSRFGCRRNELALDGAPHPACH
jgi:molybdate transport system permease protein